MISKRRFLGAKFLLVFVFSFFVFNANFGGLIVKDVAKKMDNSNQYSYINNPETSGSLIMTASAEEGWWDNALTEAGNSLSFNIDWGSAFDSGSISSTIGGWFLEVVDFLIWVAFKFISILLMVSAFVLDVGTSEMFMTKLFAENDGIYKGWTIVRDFLNLFFLFALLFSAFATIFQVEKYHLKKILILLVVMALLVNFSYPISMFIIDFSNSAMFFIKDSVFGETQSPSASVANLTNISDVFGRLTTADAGLERTLGLVTIVIFTAMLVFIVALYGFTLIIRWIILAILVVFSPVGFAFAFFPSTKSMADSWWSGLFKYAILGPLLLFFLMLAFVIFGEAVNPSSAGVIEGGFNAAGLKNLIISLVGFAVPEVFLIVGYMMAQKMGGEAISVGSKWANSAKGQVTKAMAGTAGTAWAATGIPGGVATRYGEIKDKFAESRRTREAWVAGKLGADTGSTERKKIRDDAEKMNNVSETDRKKMAASGDAAAVFSLANEGKMDAATYNNYLKNTKITDQATKNLLEDKIKEKRVDVLIKAKYERDVASSGVAVAQSNMESTLKGLSPDKWKHINFAEFEGNPYMERAIKDSFKGLHRATKIEVAKTANSNSSTAMTNMGLI